METNKKFEVPKPVSVGEVFEITVENQGGHGDGIAKIDGFIIFIKEAKKGEKIKIKIKEVKRTFAIAEKV